MYTPKSAYRIQLRHGTTFRHAADAAGYMSDLGVDALSMSSPFQSVQVGEHGLATVSPAVLDVELGAENGFAELNSRLAGAGLALIIDLNPSRMPASSENSWWFDVLEWGSRATYAGHFDIDWAGPVLLPVLERPMGEAIEACLLTICFNRRLASIGIAYGGVFYPFEPSSYAAVLDRNETALAAELIGVADQATPEASIEFHREIAGILKVADTAALIDLAAHLNNVAGDAGWRDAILDLQNWRLVENEAPVARNADNSSLTVGLRHEQPDVFEDFHREPLSLLQRTQVRGFRVNDIDMLADPESYTRLLRQRAGADAFLIADKIVLKGESAISEWQVNGTAGYEFIATVIDLLIDPQGLSTLQRHWSKLDPTTEFAGDQNHVKANILHAAFADDLAHLVQLLTELQPPSDDQTMLGRAVVDLATALPVFRAYSKDGRISPFYARALRSTAAQVSKREGHTPEENDVLSFVLGVMQSPEKTVNAAIAETFSGRFQQLAAAVTASSLEKSYQYTRGPIALDELILKSNVKPDPVGSFHHAMHDKARTEPSGMLATSYSYATKFGEDARMRLLALSEAPERWASAVERWRQSQAGNLVTIENAVVPDAKAEWLLYQTLAAIWPASLLVHDKAGIALVRDELVAFMASAIRESDWLSLWTGTDKPYGEAVIHYIDRLFADEEFLGDFVETARPFWLAGALNGLSQTVLKLTVPGVPVIRAGSETWDISPTGQFGSHPVDFGELRKGLANASQTHLNVLLEDWHSGAVKLRLVQAYLQLRQQRADLFLRGQYIPLHVNGDLADHVVAFYREFEGQYLIVAVPRLCFAMLKQFSSPFQPLSDWEQTSLAFPAQLRGVTLRHLMTGNQTKLSANYSLAEGFREFPILTLVSDDNIFEPVET
ncbi:maltooligosyl trehalose synthase [Phyllobacterium sp. YR620]|uniref:malto-oligosyltrehalose synthase n=1 Tax=Phyllobacterium sp. YR620 TaxID=1881066 RepID=UPI000883F205|nr:malto-oligosyltrehalose synthase [Phyllobacterium sp. YR620]SDP14569.1 maltooligosyl trehalose synthase [Phyllobacterium sp. YR620]